MEWFIAVVAVAALGFAAVAAAGGAGEMSRHPVRDTYRQQLPERPLTAADLQHASFGVTLRGYAMDQVDDLIDRLAREITDRDTRIAELTGVPQPVDDARPDESPPASSSPAPPSSPVPPSEYAPPSEHAPQPAYAPPTQPGGPA